jgi:hypothetical protein
MTNCLDTLEFVGSLKKHTQNSGIAIKVLFDLNSGIMNLSFKIILLEITGKLPLQCTFEKNNEKEMIEIISASLKENKMIICMAEGETGKSYQV